MPLKISQVSKTYSNGCRALKSVSLTVGTNMFGLLGPNGAGKSTLMRTVATLQEADSGEIWLDDLNVLRRKDEVRRILGYLPQEFGVYPQISAIDMLDHLAVLKGILNRKERKAAVEALLQQTNLWETRRDRLGSFSGGMKQRFGIAQALLNNPKLIIVDEPTAGLDPTERHRFLNLLSSIGRDVVVILSTHIVEDVRQLCTRMAILHNGVVILEGSPGDALDALRGRMWRKSLRSDEELAELQTSFHVVSTHLVAGSTELRIYAEGNPGEGFSAVDPMLEDAYFVGLSRHGRS
jgi:ABC-type multidrug transport system ATPase subunit